jgi:hypothetical protein
MLGTEAPDYFPDRQQIDCGRCQSSFCYAKEEPGNDEARVGSNEAHESHHQSPGESDERYPYRWPNDFEDDVAWHF